jgi:hypothetical protein
MIHANLHITADTQIVYGHGPTAHWVDIRTKGTSLSIFTKTARDAQALVMALWVIREHLHPDMVNERQAGISAEIVTQHT